MSRKISSFMFILMVILMYIFIFCMCSLLKAHFYLSKCLYFQSWSHKSMPSCVLTFFDMEFKLVTYSKKKE